MQIYDYISYQGKLVIWKTSEAVENSEGKHVSGSVYAPVEAVEVLHPRIINKEYPEFSLLKIERREKLQRILF